MLEHNGEKWGNKVKIIGLCVDDEKESVLQRVEEKNWKKVEHYRMKGWD